MHHEIFLTREVEAIQIPRGDEITLPIGTRVMITQSLGGSYTVATDFGLARIREKDADALGIESKTDGVARILAEKVAAETSKGRSGNRLRQSLTLKFP